MDVIFSASIIAAFLAGAVALFAPCCITVLLPAYLASAFQQKRHILKMTFIFFAGISVVLVPIGMGAAALAEIFRDFHRELYIAGGLFMFVLAALSVLGKNINLIPMPKRQARGEGNIGGKSVFVLGIFSGAATSCCAPVLAGAVTLAVISGAFWKALVVTFAYILGMVMPLFVTGYFYDRFNVEKSKLIIGKTIGFKFGAKKFSAHSTNIIAGAIFLIMGAILLSLAYFGDAFWAPSYQVKIGEALNKWSTNAFGILKNIPDILWGVVLIGIFLFFAYKAKGRNKNSNNNA